MVPSVLSLSVVQVNPGVNYIYFLSTRYAQQNNNVYSNSSLTSDLRISSGKRGLFLQRFLIIQKKEKKEKNVRTSFSDKTGNISFRLSF